MEQPKDERAAGAYVVPEIYPPDSTNVLYHVQQVAGDGVMTEVILTDHEASVLVSDLSWLLFQRRRALRAESVE